MKDMKGFSFQEGCKVARAVMWGQSPKLAICEVTKIDGDKLYLDDSKQPIKFPERLLIIEQEPLTRMMQQYTMSKAEK